jgi:hypothetical protein
LEAACFSEMLIYSQKTTCATTQKMTTYLLLRVFENKVVKKIFGPKWEEVMG